MFSVSFRLCLRIKMDRYRKKLAEIKAARNKSSTALKTRGIKYNKRQQDLIRMLAAAVDAPSREKILLVFPSMNQKKVDAILNKAKLLRKKLAENLGLNNEINGIRNSKGMGYIYLVENEMFSGWVKCGMTTNITSRLNTYNSNDPLKRFRVLIDKEVIDRRKSELDLMRELQIKSTLHNGEWFRIDKDKAIEIFKSI
jgi:predicted GIY-YIG superfamily endonuclease